MTFYQGAEDQGTYPPGTAEDSIDEAVCHLFNALGMDGDQVKKRYIRSALVSLLGEKGYRAMCADKRRREAEEEPNSDSDF